MDSSEIPRIPAELLARLEHVRHFLSTNGTVVARRDRDRRPAWRIRYRVREADGRCRQMSMPLPAGPVVEMVRALLAVWQDQERQRGLAERKTVQDQAQVEKDARRTRRERRRRVLALAGGGRRRRRRIAELYDQAVAKGLQAELEFLLGERYRQPNRRPGRPCKDALMPSVRRDG